MIGNSQRTPQHRLRWIIRLVLVCVLTSVVAVGAGMRVNAGTPSRFSAASGKKGGVTPLPSATPVKPRPGLTLGMITRPISQVQRIQAAIDRHEKADLFYLKPDDVVKKTLPDYGFNPPIDLVSPARPFIRYAGRPVRKSEVKYQSQLYQVFVAQPLRQGPGGVWVIVTILPQKLRTGGIAHPAVLVHRIQGLADRDKADGLIFLDPDRVVQEELPQYGFVPVTTAKTKKCTTPSSGYKVISPAKPVTSTSGRPLMRSVISYQGTHYDIYLTQPDRQGKGGIWVVASIEPAY